MGDQYFLVKLEIAIFFEVGEKWCSILSENAVWSIFMPHRKIYLLDINHCFYVVLISDGENSLLHWNSWNFCVWLALQKWYVMQWKLLFIIYMLFIKCLDLKYFKKDRFKYLHHTKQWFLLVVSGNTGTFKTGSEKDSVALKNICNQDWKSKKWSMSACNVMKKKCRNANWISENNLPIGITLARDMFVGQGQESEGNYIINEQHFN